MNKGQKIALITFALFMTEAIIHYNLGKNYTKSTLTKEDKKWIPPPKILIKLGVVVGVFSILNGIVIKNIVD